MSDQLCKLFFDILVGVLLWPRQKSLAMLETLCVLQLRWKRNLSVALAFSLHRVSEQMPIGSMHVSINYFIIIFLPKQLRIGKFWCPDRPYVQGVSQSASVIFALATPGFESWTIPSALRRATVINQLPGKREMRVTWDFPCPRNDPLTSAAGLPTTWWTGGGHRHGITHFIITANFTSLMSASYWAQLCTPKWKRSKKRRIRDVQGSASPGRPGLRDCSMKYTSDSIIRSLNCDDALHRATGTFSYLVKVLRSHKINCRSNSSLKSIVVCGLRRRCYQSMAWYPWGKPGNKLGPSSDVQVEFIYKFTHKA